VDQRSEFCDIKICQTIFELPENLTSIQPIEEGYGEGGFVVSSAKKGMEI